MTVLDNVMIPMHSKPTYSMWTAMLGLPKVKAERARMEERAMKHLRDLDLDQYCDREAGTLAGLLVPVTRSLRDQVTGIDRPSVGYSLPVLRALNAHFMG